MTKIQEFFTFLYGYIEFYEQLERQSQNRLEAITSYNLAGLERAIANDESAIMRAEQMEKQRIEMQQSAGFEQLSLRQIIEQMKGEDRLTLQRIFDRLNELLESIRFYNERSDSIIKSNLYRIEKAAETAPPKPHGEFTGGLNTKA